MHVLRIIVNFAGKLSRLNRYMTFIKLIYKYAHINTLRNAILLLTMHLNTTYTVKAYT